MRFAGPPDPASALRTADGLIMQLHPICTANRGRPVHAGPESGLGGEGLQGARGAEIV